MATHPQAYSIAQGCCDPSALCHVEPHTTGLAHESSLSNPSAELFYPSADDTPAQHVVSCKFTLDAFDSLIQISNKGIKKAWSQKWKTSWSSAKGKANSCNLGTKNPMHCYRLGSNCLGNSPAEKDTKLRVNQQCTLSARRPSASWGVSVRVRKLKVILPNLAPMRSTKKCCVSFCIPQYKREMDIMELVQGKSPCWLDAGREVWGSWACESGVLRETLELPATTWLGGCRQGSRLLLRVQINGKQTKFT